MRIHSSNGPGSNKHLQSAAWKYLLWAFLAFSFCLQSGLSATYTWRGTSGNWSSEANWNPSGIPGPEDIVNISSSDVLVDGTFSVQQVNLSGGILTGSGQLTVSQLFSWTGGEIAG